MNSMRMMAIAGLSALALTAIAGPGIAQTAGGNGGGGQASSNEPGGSGGRIWSFRGPASGPILCASKSCMATSAAAVTHSSNYPDRERRIIPILENCTTERYVYPNGTVEVRKDCPRAVTGR